MLRYRRGSFLKIIYKYQNHPTIKLIKAKKKNKSQTFCLRETNIDIIKRVYSLKY